MILYPYLNEIEGKSPGPGCLAEPIIVYQAGRVGSKSIVGSLENYGYKNVFHIHQLPDKVNRPDEYLEQTGRGNRTVLDSYIVRKYCLLGKSRIITLVRDPIERSLSGFFYKFRNAGEMDAANHTKCGYDGKHLNGQSYKLKHTTELCILHRYGRGEYDE